VSKTPGSLAAKLIPGYFGHAAIWLDNEVPLKSSRIINAISKKTGNLFKLREKGMIEALRNGVQLSNLVQYADGDIYVIMRLRSLSMEQKHSIVENTIKHLHKKYNFNFDLETPEMINCTELVYLGYDFIDWKVRRLLGRYTLYPDDILLTALGDPQFEIVAMLKNGELTMHPSTDELLALIGKN
jgi:hypothetical protein